MFEVGFTELLLIFVLGLLVLGPRKLPQVAAEIGRWVGRARALARQFREQLEAEAVLDSTVQRSTLQPGTPLQPRVEESDAPQDAAADDTLSEQRLSGNDPPVSSAPPPPPGVDDPSHERGT